VRSLGFACLERKEGGKEERKGKGKLGGKSGGAQKFSLRAHKKIST
jgi:hypothetical protein